MKIARQNAKTHGVLKKIKFYKSNLTNNSRLTIDDSIIAANLPYLTKKQLNNLTIQHEPRAALYGGKDGLKYYKELFEQIKNSPFDFAQGQNDIIILIEHDPSQKKSLTNLVGKYLPTAKIKSHKDLSGKWRVLEILI